MTINDKILQYKRLIYKVMQDLNCSKDEETQDEMFFAGLLGLINGINTYDSTKSVKEQTYFYTCIKYSIITKIHYKYAKGRTNNTISINTPLSSTMTIEDTLVSNINVEKEVIDKIMYEKILNIIETKLKNKTKLYIKQYFGINQPKLRLIDMVKLHNVSRQNIDQVIRNGIKKIKQELKKGDD